MSFTGSYARRFAVIALALLAFGCAKSETPSADEPSAGDEVVAEVDPLPSWNDTATKAAIMDFVRAVTDPDDPAFTGPDARIATFDNDGTLWVEYPMYTRILFAFDRVKGARPAASGVENHTALQSIAGRRYEDGRRCGDEGRYADHVGDSLRHDRRRF